jgi:hypothetical protein
LKKSIQLVVSQTRDLPACSHSRSEVIKALALDDNDDYDNNDDDNGVNETEVPA